MGRRKRNPDKAYELNFGTPIGGTPGSIMQRGTSLSSTMMGTFNGFLRNPNQGYLGEFERAFLTDETISVAIEFVVMSLIASLGEYQHPKKDIQKYVLDMFIHMEGTPQAAIGELVTSALWSGHGVSESVIVMDGRHYVLDSIQNYHPSWIYYVVDKHGKLTYGKQAGLPGPLKTGVYQRSPFSGMPIALPRNRTCVISRRRRHNNYYGESAIQSIYKNWLFKDAVFGMWAVALDRYGTPIPVAIVPRVTTGQSVEDPYAPGGARALTYAEQASQVFQDLSTGGSLVFEEYSKDHPVKIQTLTNQNNFGSSFLDAVKYSNQAIFRGLLIPKLLIEEGKAGSSKGLGSIHFNSFRMMLRYIYDTMVQPIVQQVIGPLVYWNFGDKDPGRFPVVPFDAVTAEMIAVNFDKLTATGLVDLSMENDMNQLRRLFGFSPVSQAQIDKRLYLAKTATGMAAPPTPQANPKPNPQAKASLGTPGSATRNRASEKRQASRRSSLTNLSLNAEPEAAVVIVVVADDNGRLLLVRRSASETSRPGEWETPGGHREPGESVVLCAIREVLEETALTVVPDFDSQLAVTTPAGLPAVLIGARLTGSAQIHLDRSEHDRYVWVWPEELEEYAPVPPDFAANVGTVWAELMEEDWEETEADGEDLDEDDG